MQILYLTIVSIQKARNITENRNFVNIYVHWTRSPQLCAIVSTIAIN